MPSTRATMLTPKLVCRGVILYRLFRTTLALASRFRSMTMLVFCLADESLRSRIPSSSLALTRSLIRPRIDEGLVWYGSSVTTIDVPRLDSTISALARILIEPRPVR